MSSPSVGTVVTTSYFYDVNDERIALGANGATTTYPFKLYNVQGNTIYKHIFANGEPVADVQGSTTTAAVYYIHDDHLGGSSVISDANANVAEVMEYYPFGGTRFDQRSGSFAEQRRSDGHEFDSGTGLLYEDARYLGPTLSRFLSEDPNFINAGAPDWVTGMPADPNDTALRAFVSTKNVNYLSNPQNLNSYSYVANNPLINKDPDGKCPNCWTAFIGGAIGGAYGILDQYAYDVGNNLINGQSLGSALTSNLSSLSTYAASAGADAAAGALIGFNPLSTVPALLLANGAKNYARTGDVDPTGTVVGTAVDASVPIGGDILLGPEAKFTTKKLLNNPYIARELLNGGISTFVNNAGTVAGGFVGGGGSSAGRSNSAAVPGGPAVISKPGGGSMINPFFVPPIGSRWVYSNATPTLITR